MSPFSVALIALELGQASVDAWRGRGYACAFWMLSAAIQYVAIQMAR